jgi:hypothetical protein
LKQLPLTAWKVPGGEAKLAAHMSGIPGQYPHPDGLLSIHSRHKDVAFAVAVCPLSPGLAASESLYHARIPTILSGACERVATKSISTDILAPISFLMVALFLHYLKGAPISPDGIMILTFFNTGIFLQCWIFHLR